VVEREARHGKSHTVETSHIERMPMRLHPQFHKFDTNTCVYVGI
jgi:hypothetical protein